MDFYQIPFDTNPPLLPNSMPIDSLYPPPLYKLLLHHILLSPFIKLTSLISPSKMAKILANTIIFTITIALFSLAKLLCSRYSINFIIPFPLVLPIAILPFILNLFSSISKSNLPPGPLALPIFGNWLQVGNDLNHRLLAAMSKTYGPVFLLKLGSKNLAVVSDPELANQVLHTQGVEFGSRPRNVVFDIFTGNGQDMVFTIYGEHWRKMRRIMTLPFFTNKVVHQYSHMWEEEMDQVVDDLRNGKLAAPAREEGIVIRKRLQLMLYNIMYRMMFDAKFESQDDPLFIEATRFNSERSRLAQSFDYNYGDFIPLLRPFLRGYLNKCRDLQNRRLAFFNNYYVEKRRYLPTFIYFLNCICTTTNFMSKCVYTTTNVVEQ